MARPRKRHVQQELDFKQWGGKRKGAGRPAKKKRASERHDERPELRPGSVVLLTLRSEEAVGNLRRPEAYHAIRYAMYAVIERPSFRVTHVSIQSNHVHLIVEADSKDDLSRGIQAFEISAAKHLNGAMIGEHGERRRGRVFSDRYHERPLGSPRQVRNAISYVLNNWRRHGEDRGFPTRKVDPYSSGISFAGWREREDAVLLFKPPRGHTPLSVSLPHTWLLRIGWKRAGTISFWAVPGPREKRELFRR